MTNRNALDRIFIFGIMDVRFISFALFFGHLITFTINMKQTHKVLLILEVLLCFGPVSLFLFQGMIITTVFGITVIMDNKPEFLFLSSIILIFCGIFGLIGIIQLTKIIIQKKSNDRNHRRILFFIFCGILSIMLPVLNGFYNNNAFNLNKDFPILIVFILPLISTFHLMHLGRYYLFLKPDKI